MQPCILIQQMEATGQAQPVWCEGASGMWSSHSRVVPRVHLLCHPYFVIQHICVCAHSFEREWSRRPCFTNTFSWGFLIGQAAPILERDTTDWLARSTRPVHTQGGLRSTLAQEWRRVPAPQLLTWPFSSTRLIFTVGLELEENTRICFLDLWFSSWVNFKHLQKYNFSSVHWQGESQSPLEMCLKINKYVISGEVPLIISVPILAIFSSLLLVIWKYLFVVVVAFPGNHLWALPCNGSFFQMQAH